MGALWAVEHFDGASLGVRHKDAATGPVDVAMIEFAGCMGGDRYAPLELHHPESS
jgi:hypothetical protein